MEKIEPKNNNEHVGLSSTIHYRGARWTHYIASIVGLSSGYFYSIQMVCEKIKSYWDS
jgi:hypothetical protein